MEPCPARAVLKELGLLWQTLSAVTARLAARPALTQDIARLAALVMAYRTTRATSASPMSSRLVEMPPAHPVPLDTSQLPALLAALPVPLAALLATAL